MTFDPRKQAQKVVAAKLQEIYGEYIVQGSADDWYEDADRLLPLLERLLPLLDERCHAEHALRRSGRRVGWTGAFWEPCQLRFAPS